MRKALFPLFFLLLVSLISPVLAQDIDVTQFDEELASAWGITSLASGLILSLIFGMAFLMPIGLLKAPKILILIMGISCLSFCVAVSWLDYWILILITMGIALLYASRIKRAF